MQQERSRQAMLYFLEERVIKRIIALYNEGKSAKEIAEMMLPEGKIPRMGRAWINKLLEGGDV